ncbi:MULTISPECIES: phosphopantetheine-binding protein [Saccharothrix]|uniref:Minimal PKS acyl carrier protein n=1 Tax=Saccharothrix longispora TaxID=33920 RepID=A0ABU1PVZ3_9PSEU|nr:MULTISPECIES: phosphopantetheine-binding protein [Saccharothrix]MDR6594817.1 minimal PKS acyl carrier protein [Saccharothrix longispora]
MDTTPSPTELAGLISRCTGVVVTEDRLTDGSTTFADLDVDSLGLMGVLAELKRNHGLPADVDMTTQQSPRELLTALTGKA